MLAAVAEMECDMLMERTQAGLARAKSEGKTLAVRRRQAPSSAPTSSPSTRPARASALARLYSVSRANILEVVKPA
jgi:DNA invertase Pin-like site-specific DNA recombinase